MHITIQGARCIPIISNQAPAHYLPHIIDFHSYVTNITNCYHFSMNNVTLHVHVMLFFISLDSPIPIETKGTIV